MPTGRLLARVLVAAATTPLLGSLRHLAARQCWQARAQPSQGRQCAAARAPQRSEARQLRQLRSAAEATAATAAAPASPWLSSCTTAVLWQGCCARCLALTPSQIWSGRRWQSCNRLCLYRPPTHASSPSSSECCSWFTPMRVHLCSRRLCADGTACHARTGCCDAPGSMRVGAIALCFQPPAFFVAACSPHRLALRGTVLAAAIMHVSVFASAAGKHAG